MASVVVNEFVASAPDDAPALFSLTRDFRFMGENGRLVHRVLPPGRKGFKTVSVTTSGHQASHLENDRLALTLPISGHAEVELGGRVSRAKPGDAFLISPSERYSRLHPETGSSYASFTVIAPPSLSKTMAPESCRLVEGWGGATAAHQLFHLRTMQVAFRERRGQTPKQVLARMRLETMRERLLRSTADTTVTSAAMDAGLFHLGRASCAYHAYFGELPSMTLQRSKSYQRHDN